MTRDDAILLDIVNAARIVQTFVQHMTKEDFLADPRLNPRLSPAFREQNPVLPWSLIAGMRDHPIHGYDAIDLEEGWNTANHDVPDVLIKLGPIAPRRADD